MAESIITCPVIASYVTLEKPQPPAPGADPRYSIVGVVPRDALTSPQMKKLKEACIRAAEAKFGKKLPSNLKMPFRPNTDRDVAPFTDHPDGVFFNAWSKNRPGVVDKDREEILDYSEVWSGQVIRMSVTPFAYDNSGNKGVSLGLNNIQILKADAPRMDGRKPAASEFEDGEEFEMESAAELF